MNWDALGRGGSGPIALVDADVVTMDEALPSASCIVISNGVITAVGDRSVVPEDLGDGEVQDLSGTAILPGFIDTHIHGGVTGLGLLACDLGGVLGIDEALGRIAESSDAMPDDFLVVASGLDLATVEERRFPTPEELDEAGGGRAAYVMGVTGHDSVVNAAAAAMILGDAPVRAGHLKGEDNTRAFSQLWKRFGEQVGIRNALEAMMSVAASGGITTVHSMDPLHVTEVLVEDREAWRINVVPYAETFDVEAVARMGLRQIGGCGTVALDGDVDPHTAALLAPYMDDPSMSGVLYYGDEEVVAFVRSADEAGLQVGLHCVGSGAIDQLLNAYEAVVGDRRGRDHRHRVEHFEIPEPGQAERAARLGVAAAVQPAFNYFWPHHGGYPRVLGDERAERVDPVMTLIEAGVRIAFGSDSPVTPLRPLLGVHAAVNHSNPRERVDVGTALKAFTSDAAWLSFDEDRRGAIKVGYDADLVVLETNPSQVPSAEIADISVHATIVGGRLAYSDSGRM